MTECIHRGDFDEFVPCNCPQGAVPVFECELRERCTVQRPAIDPAIQFCPTCEDFTPNRSAG